jgi:hypothetical protein
MSEKLNVLVGANVGPLVENLKVASKEMATFGQTATKAVGDAKKQTASGSETINSSLKSIQQNYRATYKDAQILAQTLGTDSEAFRQSAQAAAELRDKLDDVQDAINAFHPEKKFKVAADAISGAAGVAQGFVGAMTLIGLESANAEKAIAAMMSLQGIAQAAQSIEMLKGAFVALSTTMQVTLVGLAALVAGVVIYNAIADEQADANKRLADSFKQIDDSEQKTLDVVKKTQELRVRAMKDGYAKSLATVNQGEKDELAALVDAQIKGEITEMTYQMRRNAIFKHYANERATLAKEEAERLKKANKIVFQGLIGDAEIIKKSFSFEMPKFIQEMPDAFVRMGDAVGGQVNRVGVFFDELGEKIGGWQQFIVSALTNASASFGAALMSGGLEDAGKAMVKMLGGIALQIGAAMIAIGIPMLFAKVTAVEGMRLVAGGIALGIVGGAMQASGEAPGSKGGGGGGSYSGGGVGQTIPVFAGGGQSFFTLDGTVRGQDLVISSNTTRRDNRR